VASFARLLAAKVVFEEEKLERQLEMLEVAFFAKAAPTEQCQLS
jgi:hypothetical protein